MQSDSKYYKFFSYLFKWYLLALPVGLMSGFASYLFLNSLDFVTQWRDAHTWIIFFLPLAGFGIGWMYHHFGKSVEKGSALILEEIQNSQKIIPLRMTPLVLIGTLLTHLFGGSAGREGTAVQMGASLADQLYKVFGLRFRLEKNERSILLKMGISAGFASVFGTPLAGAIFAFEILGLKKIRYNALFPCLLSSFIAHYFALFLGIHHTTYTIPFIPSLTFQTLLSSLAAGAFFALVAFSFIKLTHLFSKYFKKIICYPPFRPLVGGLVLALYFLIFKDTRYLGLGIPVIIDSFSNTLPYWDFLAKIAATAWTLGSGFKGGEVTPLFFIGATLGSSLSPYLSLPLPLLAGMGFVGVFAGAANAPLTSILIAMEIFGPQVTLFAAIACGTSYLLSGSSSIYSSQNDGINP